MERPHALTNKQKHRRKVQAARKKKLNDRLNKEPKEIDLKDFDAALERNGKDA